MDLINNFDIRHAKPTTKAKISPKMSPGTLLNHLNVWRDGGKFVVMMEKNESGEKFLNHIDLKFMIFIVSDLLKCCPCKSESAIKAFDFLVFDRNLWQFVDGY